MIESLQEVGAKIWDCWTSWECWAAIIWHVMPAITTVLLGGFLVQRFFVRRANAAAYVDATLDILQKLQDDALEYWGQPASPDKPEILIIAQKIKAGHKQLEEMIESFCQKYGYGFPKVCKAKSLRDQCKPSLDDLFERATGGDFEQADHKPDPGRTFKIANNINTIRTALLHTKF